MEHFAFFYIAVNMREAESFSHAQHRGAVSAFSPLSAHLPAGPCLPERHQVGLQCYELNSPRARDVLCSESVRRAQPPELAWRHCKIAFMKNHLWVYNMNTTAQNNVQAFERSSLESMGQSATWPQSILLGIYLAQFKLLWLPILLVIHAA